GEAQGLGAAAGRPAEHEAIAGRGEAQREGGGEGPPAEAAGGPGGAAAREVEAQAGVGLEPAGAERVAGDGGRFVRARPRRARGGVLPDAGGPSVDLLAHGGGEGLEGRARARRR